MKLRTIHQEIRVNPEMHPEPLVFEPIEGGLFEGEVPDEVGNYLLSISRAGEYTVAPPPEAEPRKAEGKGKK
jgi:hypothetical protein